MGRKGIGLLSAFVALAASLLVAHPVAAAAGGPALLHAMAPVRLLDTRNGPGAAAQPLAGPGSLDLQVAGTGNVPASGVSSAVLNVTVTNPTRGGLLSVFPAGSVPPATSNLNFGPGQTVANRVLVQLGTAGQVELYLSAGRADVVVDVNGFFTDAPVPASAFGYFSAVAPSPQLATLTGTGRVSPP